MYRAMAVAVIAGLAGLLTACEPVFSLKHPQWEQPHYTGTNSDAYYQHDPLRPIMPNGGP